MTQDTTDKMHFHVNFSSGSKMLTWASAMLWDEKQPWMANLKQAVSDNNRYKSCLYFGTSSFTSSSVTKKQLRHLSRQMITYKHILLVVWKCMFSQSHTPAIILKVRLLIQSIFFWRCSFYVNVVMTGRKWQYYSILCQLKGFRPLSRVIHLDFF